MTFPANSTARQILSVTTLGDALAEGDETFAVTLTDSGLPAGVSLGTASATGTILDEDELRAVGVDLGRGDGDGLNVDRPLGGPRGEGQRPRRRGVVGARVGGPRHLVGHHDVGGPGASRQLHREAGGRRGGGRGVPG